MNFLILAGIAITAWFATKLFESFDRMELKAARKRRLRAYYNSQFYQKKVKKVQDKVFGYYLDFAQSDPIALAQFLSEREIDGIKSQRRIDYLYKQIAE